MVPEVPTILMEGGATYPGLEGGHRLIAFEAALIRLQLQMEESFWTIARSLGKPTVILMDRGSVDICAYLMPKDWLATLAALGGLTTGDLLVRYHQVIHLVTAADGAPSFYTLRYVLVFMRISLFFLCLFLPLSLLPLSLLLVPSFHCLQIRRFDSCTPFLCLTFLSSPPSFPPSFFPTF